MIRPPMNVPMYCWRNEKNGYVSGYEYVAKTFQSREERGLNPRPKSLPVMTAKVKLLGAILHSVSTTSLFQ